MKSFKDYTRQGQKNEKEQNTAQNEGASAEELTKKIASAYRGKNSADMFKDILLQAEQGKRAGTLTNEDIDNFYQSFAPMLNAQQGKKLKEIVEKLKKI